MNDPAFLELLNPDVLPELLADAAEEAMQVFLAALHDPQVPLSCGLPASAESVIRQRHVTQKRCPCIEREQLQPVRASDAPTPDDTP